MTARKSAGEEMQVTAERDGETVSLTLMPEMVQREHPVSGEVKPVPTLGVRGSALAGIEPRRKPMPITTRSRAACARPGGSSRGR